jgi:integrase
MAREWNLLETDPFERTNGFHSKASQARKVEILTPEQLRALLDAVDIEYAPYVALNAFSGLRKEEIKRLEWDEVKLDRDLIDLPAEKSKNHRRKLIEILPTLKVWLAPFAKLSGPVVPNNLIKVMQEAKRTAGITPWPQNALRHSFVSYAVVLKGIPWTAEQADHSEAMLKKHYREVVDKETAQKYWDIKP